ncbi:hypothetical protein Tco_1045844 [Tanacetum coccineum]|uniref:Uncharacterized protein n=1 Tax=Tanacetum coccineum TaxID=301880 RepID=A0ABQ5GUF0_9ASTR
MPPRRFKKKSVRKIVEKRVAKAIEKYEKTRADSNNTGGSGSTNTRGTVCTSRCMDVWYKTFMEWQASLFHGGLKVKFAIARLRSCSNLVERICSGLWTWLMLIRSPGESEAMMDH